MHHERQARPPKDARAPEAKATTTERREAERALGEPPSPQKPVGEQFAPARGPAGTPRATPSLPKSKAKGFSPDPKSAQRPEAKLQQERAKLDAKTAKAPRSDEAKSADEQLVAQSTHAAKLSKVKSSDGKSTEGKNLEDKTAPDHHARGGDELAPAERVDLGGALGAGLAGARVHGDGRAAALANARTLTVGPNLFAGRGETVARGETRPLLAREAPHAEQQRGAGGVHLQRHRLFREHGYDPHSKDDMLQLAMDWHTQLREEYDTADDEEHEATGRTLANYRDVYLPQIQTAAESGPADGLLDLIQELVNQAYSDGEDESSEKPDR